MGRAKPAAGSSESGALGALPFDDRRDAGRRLARALGPERAVDAVVVGLARGGVAVAAEVSATLGLPLDALAVRKVGHPLAPEYAIGAVTPDGGVVVRAHDGLGDAEVERAAERALAAARSLDRRIHARTAPVSVAGRACVLVDDGLATGATMVAAARWARAQGARQVTVAVPVGARETVERLRLEADQVVCLAVPPDFGAVGFWYEDFRPVPDEEVVALLAAGSDPSSQAVTIPAGEARLDGDLAVPAGALGAVVFAHGSGSSRRSARNRRVAEILRAAGLATLLFDLLTEEEAAERRNVFDVPLLAGRLSAADAWLRAHEAAGRTPIGYFGASTGAAAALWAAAELGPGVGAVVSRGGRPDLAGPRLSRVTAPTLLIVGGRDDVVLELNRAAAARLTCTHQLVVVPGATHLFEEPGALEQVAELATRWFVRHLAAGPSTP